ncbi:thermonuclease family protein [Parageobacillus thermoglucosidasius]|uniref:thermonuclease family protein n=1 Tax=Parageobacillus thermoglucosidasius TaxID=1426 RepID=UPI001F37E706|nr:thermonuclease family protein [Parageobacillus thermoglucosidasius]
MAKNKNSGLGFLLLFLIIIIYLIYQLLKWTFLNILGILGIISVIAGFYFAFTRKKYNLTLYWPIFAIVNGFFLSLFWFALKEPFNTLAILFLCSFMYFLITTIVMLIRKNVLWKRYSGITASLLVLSIIFLSMAPPLENNEPNKTLEAQKTANKQESNKESDNNKTVPATASVNNEEEKQQAQKEEQAKIEAAKKQQQQEALAKKFNLEAATVARVVDGDTFELTDGRKVRLIGVNTPESTTRHEQYGKEASNYTSSKLAGKTVWLQKDVSETDRYGRLLRIVWLQVPNDDMSEKEIRSKMFNADLVLNGYAEPSTYPPDVKYADYFRKFAREAREANKGLWAYGEYGTTKGDLDPKQSNSSTASSSSSSAKSGSSNSSSNHSSSNRSSSSNSSSNTNNISTPASSGGNEYFANCTELRKVYPNGVPSNHPAYQPKMDRDKDGYACER